MFSSVICTRNGAVPTVLWSVSVYTVLYKEGNSLKWMDVLFCFLQFTQVWKITPLLTSIICNLSCRSVHPSLVVCSAYHSAIYTPSLQNRPTTAYNSLYYFPKQCYIFPPPSCAWSAVLTGARLEVALSEDGGNGGGVIQAVIVIIWAEGWWIQSWAHCYLSFSPVMQNQIIINTIKCRKTFLCSPWTIFTNSNTVNNAC